MSRARNIKPGFFKNEVLVEIPFEFRLLFIGLWTLADREGRLEDRPVRIKMELFPADNIDINAGLQELHDRGFILRYEAQGLRYIQVLAWKKHQNPHVKEAISTIPAPCLHSDEPMQEQEKDDASPSDSLIPDSLIPDSLIPDSLIPDSLQEPSAQQAERAGVQSDAFDRFWSAYPRKQGKQDAVKSFAKLKPDQALLARMLAAITTQRQSPDWLKDGGQFIPHPATWLNGRRWEDEVSTGPPQSKPPIAQNFSAKTYTGTPDDELPSFLRTD